MVFLYFQVFVFGEFLTTLTKVSLPWDGHINKEAGYRETLYSLSSLPLSSYLFIYFSYMYFSFCLLHQDLFFFLQLNTDYVLCLFVFSPTSLSKPFFNFFYFLK